MNSTEIGIFLAGVAVFLVALGIILKNAGKKK